MVGLSVMWLKFPFPVFLLTLQDNNLPSLGPYVHPLVLCAVLAAGALILLLPRRHVIVPLLAASLLIPFDQVVLIGPLHWTMLRVLVLLGWVRVLAGALARQRLLSHGLNAVDKILILWAGISAFNIVLLWHSSAALINQLGALYNALGIYFLLRFLVRDEEDAQRAMRTLTALGVVVAGIMLLEQAGGDKLYAVLRSGAQETGRTLWDRMGALRAVAGFGNPVSAGVFGATLMPLSLALWWKGHKTAATAGFCAACVIVICSLSSTPVLACTAALLGLCLWPVRRHLPLLRWSAVAALLGLQLVMNAPVWALIQRAGVVGGSSGYHRYILVDRFFRHFGDWWLLGARNAADWGYLSNDIANQYVGIGESAGLIPFVLFIAIIGCAFQYLGRARMVAAAANDRRFLWAIGCALLAHVVAFFGLSYFDQLIVAWYALLAIISAVTVPLAEAESQTPRPPSSGAQEIRRTSSLP
ncbi:MAG TPA: hypothetical protein VJP04_10000 [Terriglobales bacterium]|nr:hypothetical protein [Terriglobales bacterium]